MKTPVVIVAVCGALSSVAACGSKEAAPAPKAAEAPVNPLEISVGDQLRGRVKTGTATWADVALSQSVAARIDVDESEGGVVELSDHNTVADLLRALNRIKASTRDIIAILQGIKAAGALHGELIIQ